MTPPRKSEPDAVEVETRGTYFHLPVDLHHDLRIHAATVQRTMSEIVADAITAYLRAHAKEAKP